MSSEVLYKRGAAPHAATPASFNQMLFYMKNAYFIEIVNIVFVER